MWQKLRALSEIHTVASIGTSDTARFMETRRAAQEVLFDNIWSHSEAFSSDLDVYYRTNLCRGLE